MSIKGLRAVFGEQYPDPVRVVTVGGKVAEMVTRSAHARVRGCGGVARGGQAGDGVAAHEPSPALQASHEPPLPTSKS